MLPIVASDSPRRSFSATASGTGKHVASLRRTVPGSAHMIASRQTSAIAVWPQIATKTTHHAAPVCALGPQSAIAFVSPQKIVISESTSRLPQSACDRISERFGFGSGGRSARRKVPCSAVSTDMVVAMLAVARYCRAAAAIAVDPEAAGASRSRSQQTSPDPQRGRRRRRAAAAAVHRLAPI